MSLCENINRRRKAGTSRPKSQSTVSDKAYKNMQAGFPNSKKNKAKKGALPKAWVTKMNRCFPCSERPCDPDVCTCERHKHSEE